MNQNISNFLLCGSAGWCMEIFWTGLHSLFTGQKTLTGKTSLLMFPIYGCAAVIAPLSVKLSSFPFFYRGILYTAGFYLVEFISGSFLKQFGMCPGITAVYRCNVMVSSVWTMRHCGLLPD